MLQTECSYTPSEIRAMTLHDVQRLSNHWRREPTLRVLARVIAEALGVKITPKAQAIKPMTYEEAKRMIAITRGRIDGVGGF